MQAKIQNGFEMVRMGRFDVEYSADDDRLCVYVHLDSGSVARVYVEFDGDSRYELVDGSTWDDQPLTEDDRK